MPSHPHPNPRLPAADEVDDELFLHHTRGSIEVDDEDAEDDDFDREAARIMGEVTPQTVTATNTPREQIHDNDDSMSSPAEVNMGIKQKGNRLDTVRQGSEVEEPQVGPIMEMMTAFLEVIQDQLQRVNRQEVSISGALKAQLGIKNKRYLNITYTTEKNQTPGIHVQLDTFGDVTDNNSSTDTPRPNQAGIPQHGVAARLENSPTYEFESRQHKRRKLHDDGNRSEGAAIIDLTDTDEDRATTKSTKLSDVTLGSLERALFSSGDELQADTLEAVMHMEQLINRFYVQSRNSEGWPQNAASPSTTRTPTTAQQKPPTRSATQSPPRDLPSANEARSGKSMHVPSTQHDDSQPAVTFPHHSDETDETTVPSETPDSILKQFNQMSKQIRWLEDCRRVSTNLHSKREETWRMSSATFHDSARRDREAYEKYMVKEMMRQGQMLSTIANEVKSLSNVTYSLKWETPGNNPSQSWSAPTASMSPAQPAVQSRPLPPTGPYPNYPPAPPPASHSQYIPPHHPPQQPQSQARPQQGSPQDQTRQYPYGGSIRTSRTGTFMAVQTPSSVAARQARAAHTSASSNTNLIPAPSSTGDARTGVASSGPPSGGGIASSPTTISHSTSDNHPPGPASTPTV